MGNTRVPRIDQNSSHGSGRMVSVDRSSSTRAARRPAKSAVSGSKDDRLKHLLELAAAFNVSVEECLRDVDVEAVHRVRTGSRRVQAMLETILREASPDATALNEAARVWLRQLKNLRRAAAPVRDLDVHRNLLDEQIRKGPNRSEPSGDHAADANENENATDEQALISQAAKLDAWLKDQRKERAEALQKQIKKRGVKLAHRQSEFFAVARRGLVRSTSMRRSNAHVALENFVRAVDSMALLDSANLHDFRKAIKKARYVAESAGEQPSGKAIAKALKEIQDVIGVWHDWMCLAQEAGAGLGATGPELTAWLTGQAEEHLREALKTTARLRARLLGEWMAVKDEAGKPSAVPRAKPRSTGKPSLSPRRVPRSAKPPASENSPAARFRQVG